MDTFPRRRNEPIATPLSSVAELLGVEPPREDPEIRGIASLSGAKADELGFLADRAYLSALADSRAAALLVSEEIVPLLGEDDRPRLVVPDAHAALLPILGHFFPPIPATPEIHHTAVLGRGVRLGTDLRIGPYAVIESGAVIGDRATLGAHVVVGAGARVGADSILHPHAVVYPGAELGQRVILHAGARVGADGFGYVGLEARPLKVPQVGRCVLEDDVEIGANTTIDRGSIGVTRVEADAKIDNLVQLGHNVSIGRGAMLAAQVGVAGSTRVGAGVLVGGQVGMSGHRTVGDGARITAMSGVSKDVGAGETVSGFYARPRAEYLRTTAAQSKVPDLVRRVREIERRLEVLD